MSEICRKVWILDNDKELNIMIKIIIKKDKWNNGIIPIK